MKCAVSRRGAGLSWQTKPSLGRAVMCSSVACLPRQHSQRDSVAPDRYRSAGLLSMVGINIDSQCDYIKRKGEN